MNESKSCEEDKTQYFQFLNETSKVKNSNDNELKQSEEQLKSMYSKQKVTNIYESSIDANNLVNLSSNNKEQI